ncbi:MAG: divalent-cation tolerance protein CutA [Verrucomicrobiae bacterium]|nr:divalent-cation tolerance protein CutA [Verrucomicrobiae bacterium]
MPQDQYLLVLCTFPNAEEARQIGTQLIELQVAACVNLIPQIESIYRWKGEIKQESEVMAVIKTTMNNYAEIEARIRELHPYDTPEVIAVPIERGATSYLNWISEVTRD